MKRILGNKSTLTLGVGDSKHIDVAVNTCQVEAV